MAQTILTDAGYKASDATFLAVGLPNTARPALQRGTVDTYLSIEPLPSIVAAKDEGTVVVDLAKNQGPEVFHDLGYNGWWASTSTIKDKPEVVARFAKALEDSYCWFSKPDNLDQVVALMQKYVKVPELSDAAFKTMVKGLLPTFGPEITAAHHRHLVASCWSTTSSSPRQDAIGRGRRHGAGKLPLPELKSVLTRSTDGGRRRGRRHQRARTGRELRPGAQRPVRRRSGGAATASSSR